MNDIFSAARAQLTYDPLTGEVRRKKRPGRVAGALNGAGHRQVRLNGVLYAAHRLGWLLHYGKWPDGVLDHINHKRDDNRLANLRDCTMAENAKNLVRYKSNTSGRTGVFQVRRSGKFIAYIYVNHQRISLGTFLTFEEAAAVRAAAEREHGFAAEHGVVFEKEAEAA